MYLYVRVWVCVCVHVCVCPCVRSWVHMVATRWRNISTEYEYVKHITIILVS